MEHVNALLANVEEKLADGRQTILGGDAINFSDLSFAAIMGLWAQPKQFGNGRADAVRVELARCPPAMQEEVRTWRKQYPRAAAFIDRLYEQQR